jgi:4-aminobutyrate aminotransferase
MIKAACEKHGALLVADEVQSGAGRTGKMWAIEHSNVMPDMLVWGKGMGGDMPMAGLSIRKDLAAKTTDQSQPNTFAGNALTAAACMANLDILTADNHALINRAGQLGEKIKSWLRQGAENCRVIGDVRGQGLMIGIEMVEDKETREPLNNDKIGQIIMQMLNRGLVMVPCGRFGNVFRFMPPLVLTEAHAQKATAILLDAAKDI